MSELKAGVMRTPHNEGMTFDRGSSCIAVTEDETEFYLKSEADKVIAELQKQVHDYAQGLYEIQAKAEKENAKLKARIAELEESGDAQRSNNG